MKETTYKLKATELTKIFPHPSKKETNIPIFAGASFEMTSKKPNFLIGVSGSGKTTLLRILMSIETINAGEVFLNEIAIYRLKGKDKIQYLKKIGYMDQFPAKYLYLNLSVKQNLANSLSLHENIQREKRNQKILEIARLFNINSLIEKKTLLLSGGELRRLSLACNLVFNPTILLCDEPTSQLDADNVKAIMEVFKSIKENFNSLIVIATHDRSILASYPTYEIKDRRISKCQ